MCNGRPSARKSFPSPAALPGRSQRGWILPGIFLAELPVGLQLLPRGCLVPGGGGLAPGAENGHSPCFWSPGCAPRSVHCPNWGGAGRRPRASTKQARPFSEGCALALSGGRQSSLGAEYELCLLEMVRLSKGEKSRKEGGWGGWGCWSLRAVPRVAAAASTLRNNSRAAGRSGARSLGPWLYGSLISV